MRKRILSYLMSGLLLFAGAPFFVSTAHAQNIATFGNPSPLSRPGGVFYATAFSTYHARVLSGNSSTGSGTSVTVTQPPAMADGTVMDIHNLWPNGPLTPIKVNDNNAETVTPTAVSYATCPAGNLGVGGSPLCATITGTFNNTHGQNADVISGTFGLQEAINEAFFSGGGTVVVDAAWSQLGGTNAMLTAAIPFQSVQIEDVRSGAPQYWTPVGGATTLAAPTTLTSTTVGFGLNGANTTGGSWVGTNTYHYCISYVDIMGQEGPCSADFSGATAGTGSTNQIGFAAPAASTGAVGYTIYISLSSGSYNLAYKVPLVTQPTAIGPYPAANGVCTLTTIETITPACAVTNATYNQTGVTAQVSALTVNTSPIEQQSTVVSTTSIYVPNAGGRTTYAYVPGSHSGVPGTISEAIPFTISAADATTVPSVLGTINLAPGFMNYAGKTIEVCGYATTSASTGTIKDIQFQWDAMGQNTAGKGVLVGDLTVTQTSTSVTQLDFCEKLQTTVTSASATGGSIQDVGGYITSSIASLSAAAAGGNTIAGATGSLNLADDARLEIIYVHTTGTDGTALTLQGVTVRVI